MKKKIYDKLRLFYKISILPAIILFIFLQFFDLKLKDLIKGSKSANFIFIGASIIFALILPIILRIIFFFRANEKSPLTEKGFICFEKLLILISQLSIYTMIIAQQLIDSQLIMIILSVIAFYSLYYYYPTEKKINLDMRFFMQSGEK